MASPEVPAGGEDAADSPKPVLAGQYLGPKKSPVVRRPYIVYDIESKGDLCSCSAGKGACMQAACDGACLICAANRACGRKKCDGSCTRCRARVSCRGTCEDSAKAGFTRPFLVGVLVPSDLWRDDAGPGTFTMFRNQPCVRGLPWDRRHDAAGGCIDQFLHYILEELPQQLNSEGKGFHGITIYAHNGGNFDHQFLLRWLMENIDRYETEVVPVQSSIQEIQVRERGAEKPMWFFRDTAKLIPLSLQEACNSLGVKGKLSHDLDMEEDDPSWDSYLRQDCEALMGVVDRFTEMVERLGGEVGLTAAATSMNLFRRKFLSSRIPRNAHFDDCEGFVKDPLEEEDGLSLLTEPVACPGCCHEFVRSAYFGGRTEILEMEGENLNYYDINSSYVHALRRPMPAGERLVEEGRISWHMVDSHVGFAKCKVFIPESCEISPLPVVDPETGKLKFRNGVLEGTWDVAELQLLEHPRVRGTILKVERVVWFRGKVIARDMMEELWKLRDKNLPGYDEGISFTAKLLGNSLYGKFGQRRERTMIVAARNVSPEGGECFLCGGVAPEGRDVCRSCEGSKPCGTGGHETSDENGLWYRRKEVDPAYVIPQIAAHVTSLARIRLFEFMVMALDLGGRVFMVDTDSVVTDVKLPCSSALGDLKDEFPGKPLRFRAVQPKVYMLEFMDGSPFSKAHLPKPLCPGTEDKPCKGCSPSKVTMKGFPKSERTKANIEKLAITLKRVAAGEKRCSCSEVTCKKFHLRSEDKVVFENPQKVRSLASKGFRGSPRVVRVEKSFQSPYDKRRLLPDGSTVAHYVPPSPEDFALYGHLIEEQAAE